MPIIKEAIWHKRTSYARAVSTTAWATATPGNRQAWLAADAARYASQRAKVTHRFYDALKYPLIFENI